MARKQQHGLEPKPPSEFGALAHPPPRTSLPTHLRASPCSALHPRQDPSEGAGPRPGGGFTSLSLFREGT